MPRRYTDADIRAIAKREGYQAHFDDPGDWSDPGLQKQKEVLGRKTRGRSKGGRKNGPVEGRYRITITVGFSDRRRRDLDGLSSSVLDSIIAVRRLLDSPSGIARLREIGG